MVNVPSLEVLESKNEVCCPVMLSSSFPQLKTLRVRTLVVESNDAKQEFPNWFPNLQVLEVFGIYAQNWIASEDNRPTVSFPNLVELICNDGGFQCPRFNVPFLQKLRYHLMKSMYHANEMKWISSLVSLKELHLKFYRADALLDPESIECLSKCTQLESLQLTYPNELTPMMQSAAFCQKL